MERLNTNNNNLKKFGVTMGVAFLLISAVFSIKHQRVISPVVLASLTFFFLALLAPRLLKPAYIIWMKFAQILAWVNTRIILSVIFYLIFLPTGLFIKLFRMDLLDRKIEKEKDSYWHKKQTKEFNPLDYERQF